MQSDTQSLPIQEVLAMKWPAVRSGVAPAVPAFAVAVSVWEMKGIQRVHPGYCLLAVEEQLCLFVPGLFVRPDLFVRCPARWVKVCPGQQNQADREAWRRYDLYQSIRVPERMSDWHWCLGVDLYCHSRMCYHGHSAGTRC